MTEPAPQAGGTSAGAAVATPPAPAGSTPPQGTAPPASAPAGDGTPGNLGDQTPTFATDKERADHYEGRHKEATEAIRTKSEESKAEREAREAAETNLAKYKQLYGDLDDGTAPPATPAGQTPPTGGDTPPSGVSKAEFERFKLEQSLTKTHPSLVEHAETVEKLTSGGISYENAVKSVAMEHNITLGPTPQPGIEQMPTTPPGGGAPAPSGTGLSQAHEESLSKEMIDPEVAKKAMPSINRAWNKALRR